MKRPNYRRVLASIFAFALVYGSLLTLLLRLESGQPNSKLNTVQDAMWYMVETLTTVGYGDALPVTYWGRMIGFVFLLSSLGVYGFIIGQIANIMGTLREQKNIREASIVFVNLNDDTEKLVYIINIKKHFENLNYVVTLDNGNLKSTFMHAGVTYTISKNEISSKLLASYIYEPDVAFFSEELIAYAHEADEYDMKQLLVKPDNIYANTPYNKAFFDLKKDCNVVLIGLVKHVNGVRKLMKNPEGDVRIETGDYLLMMMDGKGRDKLSKLFHIEEGI
ncbi:MAG: ion transporter [Bacteroidetes bacterium]|nr:ion transporter [Bacteroidota bacterium]